MPMAGIVTSLPHYTPIGGERFATTAVQILRESGPNLRMSRDILRGHSALPAFDRNVLPFGKHDGLRLARD
jgi:hypothetical protein